MSNHPPTRQFLAGSNNEHQAMKKPRVSSSGSSSMVPGRRTNWYKTKLCQNFKWGRCSHGEACTFAHGVNDIRNTWPVEENENEKGMFGSRARSYDELQLCRLFSKWGTCVYGNNCRFRHVKSIRDESVISISKTGDEYRGSLSRGSGQFGYKRCLDVDFDTDRGRHCGKQNSVAAGRGLNGGFGDRHAVLRKLSGYTTTVGSGTEQKTWATCTEVPGADFKWNELGKISRVYADWIEDIPLIHTKLEC